MLDLINGGTEEEEKVKAEELIKSNRAIQRVFGENEWRRSAPLTAENAVTVTDTMRAVSSSSLPCSSTLITRVYSLVAYLRIYQSIQGRVYFNFL